MWDRVRSCLCSSDQNQLKQWPQSSSGLVLKDFNEWRLWTGEFAKNTDNHLVLLIFALYRIKIHSIVNKTGSCVKNAWCYILSKSLVVTLIVEVGPNISRTPVIARFSTSGPEIVILNLSPLFFPALMPNPGEGEYELHLNQMPAL